MLIKQALVCLINYTLRSAQVRRISWVRGVVGRNLDQLMASSYHSQNPADPFISAKPKLLNQQVKVDKDITKFVAIKFRIHTMNEHICFASFAG